MVISQLTPEDLKRYREVCALVEVAKCPPQDMTTSEAQRAWISYYEIMAELHEACEISDADRLDVVISPGSGNIYLED